MSRRFLVSPVLVLSLGIGALPGCSGGAPSSEQEAPLDGPTQDVASTPLESPPPNALIKDLSTAACSTEEVLGISKQLAEQMALCDAPGEFTDLRGLDPSLELTDVVEEIPYVYSGVADGLKAAIKRRKGATLRVNSAYRTLAQQYMLFKAHEDKRDCQKREVATPGGSNHNAGLGVDVSSHAAWKDALEKENFTWYGEKDDVHFDYRKNDKTFMKDTGAKLKALTILAFQRLWNQNHPEDPIDESGKWDDDTRTRLEKSPAAGFPLGPACSKDLLLTKTGQSDGRVRLPSGRVATLTLAASVPVTVSVVDENSGDELVKLDPTLRKEANVVGRGLGGIYRITVAGPKKKSEVTCRTELVSGFFPRQSLLICRVDGTTENVKLRIAERRAGDDEDLGAVVLDGSKGAVPFKPFTRADIKKPGTDEPYEPGAVITIEEDGEVFWRGTVEQLVLAMNEAEKEYAARGQSLRDTGELNLVELARSNVLVNGQRAEALGLRSEVTKDKIKEPLRQCPKLKLDDLGLPPPPNMTPVDGDPLGLPSSFAPGSFAPGARAASSLTTRSAASAANAALTTRASTVRSAASSGVSPTQLVTLADGTRLEAGQLLDRLNQQQDALCSMGYDYVSNTPLGDGTSLTALLQKREAILQELGISKFSKYFNLATLAEVQSYADILAEIDDVLKGKMPSGAQLQKWAQEAGLELPADLKVPELPNIPSPVMPKRTDLKLLKRKTWDGLNLGDHDVAAIYSNAWYEVRGQERSPSGPGSELDARGEGKAGAYILGNEVNLVYGSGRFTATPTLVDGTLLLRVLGQDIIDKELSAEVAAAESERAWDYADSLKYEESFMVGPVPVTVKAELEGSMYLAYEYGLSLQQVYGRLVPGAAATLRVQGGVGVSGLSVGAMGEMTVIDASVPITGAAALRFEDDLPFLQLSVTGDLNYHYLDGRLAAYAEWPWFSCSLRRGCRFTKKRAERELFAWNGERGTRRILNWGMDLRPFGASIKGDLIDQTDRAELAALEAAASLEALKQETGKAEQQVYEKERATFRAITDDLSSPKASRVYEQIEAFKKAASSLDAQTVELVRLASSSAERGS